MLFLSYLSNAIGSYYQAQAQRRALMASESAARFQQRMAEINVRQLENEAVSVLDVGNRAMTTRSTQYRQVQGEQVAQQAASGVDLSSASAAEARASVELANQVDRLTMRSNAVAEANRVRMQAEGQRAQVDMLGLSARNLMRSRRVISPWSGAITGLLDLVGQSGSRWQRQQDVDRAPIPQFGTGRTVGSETSGQRYA